MSPKRIPREDRKGRGRIKYDYDDLSRLCFDKATNSVNMCSKTILQEDNQDVIQSPRNHEETSELEISASTNFSLSTQTELGQDIAGENMDEWFKQRTESVSSIDLDVVMKNEGMDTTYLTENIGHHFLSNKDVDMTSIVTNICDIGLGLDIPTNASARSKNKSITEADCDNVILNNYSTDQDTLLNDLDRSDLLDKDMLVGNSEINSSHKVDLLDTVTSVKQTNSADHVIGANEGPYTLVEDTAIHMKQDKRFKGNLWNGSDITDTQPLIEQYTPMEDPSSHKKHEKEFKENLWNASGITDTQPSIENEKEKANWESLSTINKQSVDGDSEKEIDFPELNLITFQIEPSDTMCTINQLPHVETDDKEILLSSTTGDNDKAMLGSEKDIPSKPVDLSSKKKTVVSTGNHNLMKNIPNSSFSPNMSTPISKTTVLPMSNPRSLLKSPLRISNTAKKSSILKHPSPSGSTLQTKSADVFGRTSVESQQEQSKVAAPVKKAPSMAIIAISTDKSKNTTEIVINSPYGEQVFKGKTTDLMKATSGLWQKLDNNKIQKADQPLTISMTEGTVEQPPVLDGKDILVYVL